MNKPSAGDGYEEFLEAMPPKYPDSNELGLEALKLAKPWKPKRSPSTDQRVVKVQILKR